MGHSRAEDTTVAHLESATLPTHGKTYTVVSHKSVIANSKKKLKDLGFTITRELYRSNKDANVAQGIYHIIHDTAVNDPELGMMFAWTNSYDKSTRFQCGIGAHVFVCSNGLIHGDLSTYGRKHTGNADADIDSHIAAQIGLANHKFKQLVTHKELMKTLNLSTTKQAELLGRLFVEEKLLDSQQLSIVKSEMEKSSYNYGVDPDTAWMFYNNVTHALKKTHPRRWMDNQGKFHKFMESEIISAHVKFPQDSPPVDELLLEDVDIDSEIKKRQMTMDNIDGFSL